MSNYHLANVFNDHYTYNHTTLSDIDADADCYHSEILTRFCPLGSYEAIRRALDALVKGTLTHEDVSLLIKWSYILMCCVTVYLGLLLMIHNILMLSFCSGTVLVHVAAFHVFL
jgi:hypothetical protein